MQNVSVVGDLYPECVKESMVRRYNPTKQMGEGFEQTFRRMLNKHTERCSVSLGNAS